MTHPMPAPTFEAMSCPIPIADYPHVLLAHGGGGKLSRHLIEKMFVPVFSNDELSRLQDGAVLHPGVGSIAISTDSFVVNPIFFPGGDIGSLAVHGTVNDVAMCGARPIAITVGFILEEGLPMEDLWRIVLSMKRAAVAAGVEIVTGDTKVVDRGKGDRIYINTTGVGVMEPGVSVSAENARPGDVVIVSGPIAAHGIAIMSVREGIEFETRVQSDTAPLNALVADMFGCTRNIHVLRDPTRGGVATALNEIAAAASCGMELRQSSLPVAEEVRGACEILGLDPLYVANEGILLAILPPELERAVLEVMRRNPLGQNARSIGRITEDHPGVVVMNTDVGGTRVVDMLSGEQLPRIC